MSALLFDLRNEDLNNSIVLDRDGNQIPTDFVDGIMDDEQHQKAMKEQIRMSVLEAVTQCPSSFNTDDQGDYVYTAPDTYDHSYVIDTYVELQYMKTQKETVYQCTECEGRNVQVKAWVLPNQGMKFVDEVCEGDELGWCEDCEMNVYVETAEVPRA